MLKARPHSYREIPAVQILRQIWLQNYRYEDGQVRWREAGDIPPATLFINSPYESRGPPWQETQHDVDGLQSSS